MEGVMDHILSHCPLIEHLTLDNPLSLVDLHGSRTYWVTSLSLHGLQKLKGAVVKGIQEVYIDAPNLEKLCYCARNVDAPSFKLNLDRCTNLRWLSLAYFRSTDEWLHELLYKVPFLDSLTLHDGALSERINISAPQLKYLKLSHHYDNYLKERISNQLEVNAFIDLDRRHLYRLREFLQNIKPQKVLASLSLFIHEQCAILEGLAVLKVASSPPSIKSMRLCVSFDNKAHYFLLMNWLLSCCFLETISFSLQSRFNMKPFIVYFYEMLMGNKKVKRYCCSRRYKCWWHGLNIAKVTHLERTYENVDDIKAMLNALQESDAEEFITFGLAL
ncbi:hypothetical protein PIB30_049102 [Stylosanthes scabra]|uniref:Uncharacterized protein n=1 Tax=Stylosanthes scabra TaxID=79078 RepID=A0ABU6SHP5_9FABA|nr:hypothetical protein [Stylosanthes scabra]